MPELGLDANGFRDHGTRARSGDTLQRSAGRAQDARGQYRRVRECQAADLSGKFHDISSKKRHSGNIFFAFSFSYGPMMLFPINFPYLLYADAIALAEQLAKHVRFNGYSIFFDRTLPCACNLAIADNYRFQAENGLAIKFRA